MKHYFLCKGSSSLKAGIATLAGTFLIVLASLNIVLGVAGLPSIGISTVSTTPQNALDPTDLDISSAFPLIEKFEGALPPDWDGMTNVDVCDQQAIRSGSKFDPDVKQTAMNDCLMKNALTVGRKIGDVSISVTYYPPKNVVVRMAAVPGLGQSSEWWTRGMANSYMLELKTSYGCSVVGYRHAMKGLDAPIGCTSDKMLPPVPGGLQVSPTSFWFLVEMDVFGEARAELGRLIQKRCGEASMSSNALCSIDQGTAAYETQLVGQYSTDEGIQRSTQATGFVWSKDSVTASCGGFWLPFAAPFGCRTIDMSFNTKILAWDAPAVAGALVLQQTELYNVNTDPFGIASESYLDNAGYLCYASCEGLSGKYGGCLGQVLWHCDIKAALRTTRPSIWAPEVAVDWVPPGSTVTVSATYSTVIYKYHMDQVGKPELINQRYDSAIRLNPLSGAETRGGSFTPLTDQEWGPIAAKMASLPLVDRILFTLYVNRLNGYCDATCISQFTTTPQALGSEDQWGTLGSLFGIVDRYWNYGSWLCPGAHSCGFAAEGVGGVGAGALSVPQGDVPKILSHMHDAATGMLTGRIVRDSWIIDATPHPSTLDFGGYEATPTLCGYDNYECYSPVPLVAIKTSPNKSTGSDYKGTEVTAWKITYNDGTSEYSTHQSDCTTNAMGEPKTTVKSCQAVKVKAERLGSLLSLVTGEYGAAAAHTFGNYRVIYYPCEGNECRVKIVYSPMIPFLEFVDSGYLTLELAPSPGLALLGVPTGVGVTVYFADWLIVVSIIMVAAGVLLIGVGYRGRKKRAEL